MNPIEEMALQKVATAASKYRYLARRLSGRPESVEPADEAGDLLDQALEDLYQSRGI